VVVQVRVRRHDVRAREVGPRLQRRVDQPVEREQAEEHDQDHGDPEQPGAVEPRSLTRRAGGGRGDRLDDRGGAHTSSARVLMFPPTKRMYRNETSITVTNASTESAEPSPMIPF